MGMGYRTTQACELSGASYRQADYLARTGVLIPVVDAAGSGSQRRYSLRDVQVLWALVELGRIGVGCANTPDAAPVRQRVALELRHAPEFAGYLVVTEHQAVLVHSPLEASQAITRLAGPVVVLDLNRCPARQEVLVR